VNMTYYSEQEIIAGINFEVMKVVRIKKGWSERALCASASSTKPKLARDNQLIWHSAAFSYLTLATRQKRAHTRTFDAPFRHEPDA
jgi:hypothetical protein